MLHSIRRELSKIIGWTDFTVTTFTPNAGVPGQSMDVLIMGLKLGYTRRDINKMYYSFKKLDVYNTNKVEFASFCEVNRINNPLGEAIFYKILEIEKNGEITFESYLLCIWNAFSIFDNSSMAELVFQLFDTDKSGENSRTFLPY
jgi:Ca2+-binding EF-hand superfamily protein